MILARTIGTVTLSKSHPSLSGATLILFESLDSIDRLNDSPLGGETQVAWDLCSSGNGDLVAIAEGPEAAQPFRPKVVCIDASIVALIDHVELTSENR
jgi:microcompartment protein CcmK/EutM